jgi:cytochrome c peroxidase
MHDGSIRTLEDVLRLHYAKAGRASLSGKGPSPLRSELVMGFDISNAEVKDLVEFLHTLTDTEFLTNPKLSNPW